MEPVFFRDHFFIHRRLLLVRPNPVDASPEVFLIPPKSNSTTATRLCRSDLYPADKARKGLPIISGKTVPRQAIRSRSAFKIVFLRNENDGSDSRALSGKESGYGGKNESSPI